MKKALIFDPYLDTLGGGERYALTFALRLADIGYQVEIAWPSTSEISQAEKRFGLDLSPILVSPNAYHWCNKKASMLDRWRHSRSYDLIFWVSDGSLPFLFSRNNLIHFQVPFTQIGGNKLITCLKSFFVNHFVYNSHFTQSIVEKNLPKNKSFVLYPPIDTHSFTIGAKEDLILSVARFDKSLTNKHHDILIDAFKLLIQSHPSFRLVLAGGLKGDSNQIASLRQQARDLPIEFLISPDFEKIKNLYAKAKFFWHAAGFGINESMTPEKVEHFGMTTVEAMSAGVVPIVINKGGQKEIITTGSGILCDNSQQIANNTSSLITNAAKYKSFSRAAIDRSTHFSLNKFYQAISKLL